MFALLALTLACGGASEATADEATAETTEDAPETEGDAQEAAPEDGAADGTADGAKDEEGGGEADEAPRGQRGKGSRGGKGGGAAGGTSGAPICGMAARLFEAAYGVTPEVSAEGDCVVSTERKAEEGASLEAGYAALADQLERRGWADASSEWSEESPSGAGQGFRKDEILLKSSHERVTEDEKELLRAKVTLEIVQAP